LSFLFLYRVFALPQPPGYAPFYLDTPSLEKPLDPVPKNEKPITLAIGLMEKYELLLTFLGQKLLNLSDSGGSDIEYSPASSND
jgi:hypothetical protein